MYQAPLASLKSRKGVGLSAQVSKKNQSPKRLRLGCDKKQYVLEKKPKMGLGVGVSVC